MLTTHKPIAIPHQLVPLHGIHLLQDERYTFPAYQEQIDTVPILSSFLTTLYFWTEKNDERESNNIGALRAIAGPLVKLSWLRVEVGRLQTEAWLKVTQLIRWQLGQGPRTPDFHRRALFPTGMDQHSWQADYLMSQIILP